MVVQYSDSLLEKIAVGLSTFSPKVCPELRERAPLVEVLIKLGWLETAYVKLKPRSSRALRHALRRMDAAGRSYSEMRNWLIRFRETSKPGSPNIVAFFSALNSAESCLLNFYVAIGSVNFLAEGPRAKTDDAVLKRIILLANSIKHSEGQANSKAQRGDITALPVYFGDLGVRNGDTSLSFLELHERLEAVSDWITEFTQGLMSVNPLDSMMKIR